MAKPLKQRPPTSSVAGMLDPTIGNRIAAVKPTFQPSQPTRWFEPQRPDTGASEPSGVPDACSQPEPRAAFYGTTVPSVATAMIARQFSLTPQADRTVRLLIDAIARGSGLELNQSELLRSLLLVAEQALDSLPIAAVGVGMLRRPQNHRDRQGEQARLELEIAKILRNAMRAASVT